MTPDETRILAQDADHVLQNRAFKLALEKLKDNLNRRQMSCNVAKEPEVAADIVRCQQLLAGIERELQRLISDGEVAKAQLRELDKKKLRVFSRGH